MWEKKNNLTLLGVTLSCLAALWLTNVYQLWWDHTPWVDLGSPPDDKAVRIGQIEFPGRYLIDPNPSHFLPNSDFHPAIPPAYVYGHKEVYKLDNGNWTAVHSTKNPILEPTIVLDEQECAAMLEKKWRLHEDSVNARWTEARGYCLSGYYQYTVYRLDDHGKLRGKYLNANYPEYFRFFATVAICILSILLSPVWNLVFLLLKSDFFLLKPDYGAK